MEFSQYNNMKDKILFWLDGHLLYFCLAYSMSKKYNADYFAIIDITNKPKKFFQGQKFVDFKKTWFYNDHIKKNLEKIDLDYLTNFERKYGINLWKLAINERLFYKYNSYHKFTRDEILAILEQECKLFEKIVYEIKPNFLVTQDGGFHHGHLLCELCRQMGIKILMINISKIYGKCYISQKIHTIDYLENLDAVKGKNLDFPQLVDLINKNTLSKPLMKFTNEIRSSKHSKLKAVTEFLLSANVNPKTHYQYYGRNKIHVLIKEIINIIRTRYRGSYIDKHFSYDIDDTTPFIYLPLHQEPERSLLLDAPFYTNQIETILHIAKSIPVGFLLYVKEHPTQGRLRGWRSIYYYKDIQEIPNVRLIHPSVSSEELIKKCTLVISVGGTTAFEAAFFQKPSIMFTDLGYSILPSIFKVKSLDDLPKTIKLALETNVNHSDLDKYVTALEENSFEFDWLDFIMRYQKIFFHDGNLVDVDIEQKKMALFLEKEKTILDKLADEHIKKIEQHKIAENHNGL